MRTRSTVELPDLVGEHRSSSTRRLAGVMIFAFALGIFAMIVFGAIRDHIPPAAALSVVLVGFSVCLVMNVDQMFSVFVVTETSFSKHSPIWFLSWELPSDDIRVIEVGGDWRSVSFLIRCHSGEMKEFLAPPSMAKFALEHESN